MNKSVHDGICNGRIGKQIVSFSMGNLSCQYGGILAMPYFINFKDISAFI